MSAINTSNNPLKLLTDSSELKFHSALSFGELLAWDKNQNQFVFCTKSKFRHWLDSILPSAQNTSISTITQKIDEFCTSTQGALVLSQLNQSQIDNLNRNMTDLALKVGKQTRDIHRKEILIETNGVPYPVISKRKIVEDSDHFNIQQVERARRTIELRWTQLQQLAESRRKTQYLHAFVAAPLNAPFRPFQRSFG